MLPTYAKALAYAFDTITTPPMSSLGFRGHTRVYQFFDFFVVEDDIDLELRLVRRSKKEEQSSLANYSNSPSPKSSCGKLVCTDSNFFKSQQ